MSYDIKLYSEVEKIWINYDTDGDGTLDINEISGYLKERFPHIPDQGYENTLAQIDLNKDGGICKKEMFDYLKILMGM